VSDILEMGFDLDRAVAFNSVYGLRLWGDIQFQRDLLAANPGLALSPTSKEFADATHELQRDVFEDEIEHDGKFGAGTWAAAVEYYKAGSDLACSGVIRSGAIVSADPVMTPLVTWRDEGGLDLHRDGGGSRRKNSPDIIVLHWGGRNARSCRNALASRDLSSHFGTDRGKIFQWLDLSHKAWHAGSKANGRSIGVDICQQPTVNLAPWYEARGYGLQVVANPSTRGARQVLTLHPETVKATADLLRVLNFVTGIPLRFPQSDKVLSRPDLENFRGVLGHHHISKRKWDIAPWLPALKRELGL